MPNYLAELKPTRNVNRHNRNLRSNNNLDIPYCRINKYKHSYLPKVSILWNELNPDVRNLTCYSSFKSELEKKVPVVNKLFNLGNRKYNIIMSRIRMNCIFNGHLFQLKLLNDSRCKCGYMFEDAVHFFLVGPRNSLLNFLLHYALLTCNHCFTAALILIMKLTNKFIYMQLISSKKLRDLINFYCQMVVILIWHYWVLWHSIVFFVSSLCYHA